MIGDAIHKDGRGVGLALILGRYLASPVGILVGPCVLHVQFALCLGRDGEGDVHLAGIALCRARIGRNVLVVYIVFTADIPVVGFFADIAVVGIAVVHNALGAVDKVARSFHLALIRIIIGKLLVRHGPVVGFGQCGLASARSTLSPMLILGIHIATTLIGRHIDKVQLHHARDVAIVLLGRRCARSRLLHKLQPHTRGQGHLVGAGTVVALAVAHVIGFPFQIGFTFL